MKMILYATKIRENLQHFALAVRAVIFMKKLTFLLYTCAILNCALKLSKLFKNFLSTCYLPTLWHLHLMMLSYIFRQASIREYL